MRVAIHELDPRGRQVLAGYLVLTKQGVRPEPHHTGGALSLLNNILANVVVPAADPEETPATPGTDPRAWLEGLHLRLKTPYLLASKVEH